MSPAALDGVRVVHLAALGPVPMATMLLADLGADVVRIDAPARGAELTGLELEDDPRSRGQRGLGLDLKHPAGRAVAHQLIGRADVFLEGMRPGVAERLGLRPDELRRADPRLIYGRMTGWGQVGPRAARAGHDINYLALAGALHPLGPADQPPVVPLNLVGDFGGGATYLVIGVLAALVQRATTGQGQVIDCAMVDGVASLTAMFHGMLANGSWSDHRQANLLDGAAPFYRSYRTADNRFIAVGALEPQFYAALLDGLGLDPGEWPQHDRDRWPAQAEALAAIFAGRTRDEWAATFAGSDACVSPVLSMREAGQADELRAGGTFVEWDGLVQPAPAPRLSAAPPPAARARSGRGSHTDQILTELGLEPQRISELRAERAVF